MRSFVHEHHLKRFVAARHRGDRAEMRRSWEEVVIDVFEQMDGFVANVHKGRLDAQEHETALAMVLARFSTKLIWTFEGVSAGELVNATQTMVKNIVKDVIRASIAERERYGRSFDEDWDAEAEDARYGESELDEALRRQAAQEAGAEAREFLDWALPRIPSDDQRRAAEMSLHGSTVEEIQEELGVSRDYAYQLRSRAFKRLRELKRDFDA